MAFSSYKKTYSLYITTLTDLLQRITILTRR
jgi:hypothetical protein